jgi:hypothetical protein
MLSWGGTEGIFLENFSKKVLHNEPGLLNVTLAGSGGEGEKDQLPFPSVVHSKKR